MYRSQRKKWLGPWDAKSQTSPLFFFFFFFVEESTSLVWARLEARLGWWRNTSPAWRKRIFHPFLDLKLLPDLLTSRISYAVSFYNGSFITHGLCIKDAYRPYSIMAASICPSALLAPNRQGLFPQGLNSTTISSSVNWDSDGVTAGDQ